MSAWMSRALVGVVAVAMVSACTPSSTGGGDPDPETFKQAILLTPNVEADQAGVDVSTRVTVLARGGQVTRAKLLTADGKTEVPGRIDAQGWTADERLEPGLGYRLTVTGKGEDGVADTVKRSFTTQQLTLDQQTYPSVAPLDGETVGVGMPVIVRFDLPVKDRALYEKNMIVTTNRGVTGAWTWLSDSEAHYRPMHYWPAHTRVNVRLLLNSLPAGNGIYGQQDQDIDFRVGQRAVTVVNVAKHQLRYTVDGKTVRRMPVTNGDADHQTREGVKVIMEKFSSVDMDAATTGVDSTEPGYYNISDVRWAMRVTQSGEFLHAAPWSVGSQGVANVSHGCTGMTTANAKWLYEHSRRGDVVKYVNSSRPLEDRNGWTDWNVSWRDWKAGSALFGDAAADS